MTGEDSYQQRDCAFVDILGFGQLIATLDDDPTQVRSLSRPKLTSCAPSLFFPVGLGPNSSVSTAIPFATVRMRIKLLWLIFTFWSRLETL